MQLCHSLALLRTCMYVISSKYSDTSVFFVSRLAIVEKVLADVQDVQVTRYYFVSVASG